MIDPDMARPKDGDTITVRDSPPPIVPWGAPHHSIPPWLTIMYVYSVDDDVCHELYSDAGSTSNVYISSSAIYSLVGIHDQLLFQLDHHVPFEYDPQWLILDDCMP
uniref:Uncharacterized protein n=1 Tax=Opuntia streptacantha TaxID=393608 RepID=A0A7C9AZG7_OPUST